MKTRKILWILAGFINYVTAVDAQSNVSVEASQLYTSFKFSDSTGTSLNSEYSGTFTGAYNVGYRFIAENGFMLNVGAGMRNAGATMVYDDMNYSWDLQYFNGQLGLGYMLLSDIVSPYLNVSGYYAYMLRGFQTINNEDFNIIESGSINKSDYGFTVNPGVQFTITDEISTYMEFKYLSGLKNLETDDSQKSKNFAYGLTLGLSISIGK